MTFLLFAPGLTRAQDTTRAGGGRIPSWRIGARAHYGFIMPHRKGMRHLVKGHIRTAALVFERPTSGRKEWQRQYMRPAWGVTATYTDLANPEMLGKGLSIFPYIDFPLWKGKKGGLFFRTGTGFGWIEKPYRRVENHRNIAIGSHGNITFSFMLHGKWQMPGRWSMSAGFAFDHFSNMAVRKPNLGINLPAVQMAVMRDLGPMRKAGKGKGRGHKLDLDQRNLGDEGSPWRYMVLAGGGVKGLSAGKEELFPTATLMGYVGRKVSQKSRLGVGPDLEWNSTLRHVISGDDREAAELPRSHNARMGMKAAYSLAIDRLRLIGQWGVYLYNRHEKQGPFYHRFGIRYDMGRMVLNGTLKTHFAKADHFELGLGYRLGGS